MKKKDTFLLAVLALKPDGGRHETAVCAFDKKGTHEWDISWSTLDGLLHSEADLSGITTDGEHFYVLNSPKDKDGSSIHIISKEGRFLQTILEETHVKMHYLAFGQRSQRLYIVTNGDGRAKYCAKIYVIRDTSLKKGFKKVKPKYVKKAKTSKQKAAIDWFD